MKKTLLHLSILINFAICRDFYLGMFKKNDLLMSQDTVYKERVPFRVTYAKYGRLYNCPITYVRVIDRLNIGRGPRVEIIRGGLRKKYIVLRLTSPYNNPISANVFVGCENNKYTRPPWKIIRPTTSTPVGSEPVTVDGENTTVNGSADGISATSNVTDDATETGSPGEDADAAASNDPSDAAATESPGGDAEPAANGDADAESPAGDAAPAPDDAANKR